MINNLSDFFKKQKKFNDLIYSDNLTQEEKEEITKTLSLCLHSEVSSLISSINFKDHRSDKVDVDLSKIVYESVDAFRYILAILNLWGVSEDVFSEAFECKDLLLHTRHKLYQRQWIGQPVAIVDLDDVIIEFRQGFINWLEKRYDITINRNSSEYYTTADVVRAGLNPEAIFDTFIEEKNLLSLLPNIKMIDTINKLRDQGVWIHLLTARPKENLTCFYNTLTWVESSGLKYDRIDFSPEKYRWCAQSEYFNHNKIAFAIDDSSKHAAEYAKHGIHVFLPDKSYNKEVQDMKNITVYTDETEVFEKIKNILPM